MQKYSSILILMIVLVSCKTQKPITQVPVHNTERIVEKKIPVTIPEDSTLISALFECDSTNKVILQELSESKTKRVSTDYSLQKGKFVYKTRTLRDTVYVYSTDTIRTQEKPIEVVREVNVLSRIQKILIVLGVLFVLLVIYKITRIII